MADVLDKQQFEREWQQRNATTRAPIATTQEGVPHVSSSLGRLAIFAAVDALLGFDDAVENIPQVKQRRKMKLLK